MIVSIKKWFQVAAFLLTPDDSSLSLCDERNHGYIPDPNPTAWDTAKTILWMMISILTAFLISRL